MASISEIQVSRHSTTLLVILVVSISSVVFLSFYKFYRQQDYLIYIKTFCDTSIESCFLEDCGDVRCVPNDQGKFAYKIFFKKASNTPSCDGENCAEIFCKPQEEDCEEFHCNNENISKFELDANCS